MADFGPALRLLRSSLDEEAGPIIKRPSSLTWIAWIRNAGKRVRGTKALAAAVNEGRPSVDDRRPSVDAGSVPPATLGRMGSMGRTRQGADAPTPMGTLSTDFAERAAALDAVVGGEHGSVASSDILPLHLLDVCDVEYMELLYSLLRSKAPVVKYGANGIRAHPCHLPLCSLSLPLPTSLISSHPIPSHLTGTTLRSSSSPTRRPTSR
jgi:hypothetical protein